MTSLKRPSKKGYILPGPNTQVLLLHGYTGVPYDLHPVAHYLNAQGCHVAVPLLKGHGTKPRDIHGVSAEDWLDQATHELSLFDPARPKVIGGLSMGALIALVLATRHHHPVALALFSPALHLGLLAEATILSANWGILEKHRCLKKLSGGSDINDPVAKAKTPSYKEMPVDGLMEFDRLRKLALGAITLIPCKTFLAFGKLDAAIDVQASHNAMMAGLKTPTFCRFYENSKHVVTLDYDRDQVAQDLWHFLNHFA